MNNLDQEVDDVERTLRFEAAPTIAADQSEAAAKILVPGDLPRIAYDLAIQAELLAADNKSVRGLGRHARAAHDGHLPISLELASQAPDRSPRGPGPNRQTDRQDQSRRRLRAAGQRHA